MANLSDTTEFGLNIGINAGYFHANEEKDPVKIVTEKWHKLAEEIFKDCGIYIGAVICQSKTVYRPEWGCPPGGEDTLTISGVRNPEFQTNDDLWKIAVSRVAIRLASELQQSAAYLTFKKVELLYLKVSA